MIKKKSSCFLWFRNMGKAGRTSLLRSRRGRTFSAGTNTKRLVCREAATGSPRRTSCCGRRSPSPTKNAGQISWTEVSKFIARAKLTKIPRTALECKERWMLISNNPSIIPSPQAIATNSDAAGMQHNYSFNNYTFPNNSPHLSSHHHPPSHPNTAPATTPNSVYYSSAGPGPAVVVC